MEKLKKYLLLAFLIENITAQTTTFASITGFLFYVFLALGALMVFDPQTFSSESLKKYSWMYVLMAIYVFYQLFLSPEPFEMKGIFYVLAKISSFLIIISSLNQDYEFYEEKMPIYLAYIIAAFIVFGTFMGGFQSAGGRERLGFVNSNTTGSWGAIMVGCVLFHTKYNPWSKSNYILVLIGLFAILASGSRASILMIAILVFFRYGISTKTVTLGLFLIAFSFVILPLFHINSIAIERVVGTLNGTVNMDREAQREAAKWMIQQKPLTGWGFQARNQGYALMLTELGSHNGYLETVKYIGLPCGILWFIFVILPTLSYWCTKIKFGIEMDVFFALVLMLYVKSLYEGLFTGVHELETNIFFVALAMLTAKNYQIKYDQDNQFS